MIILNSLKAAYIFCVLVCSINHQEISRNMQVLCAILTRFRLAWCAILKNVHFWNMFQIGIMQTLSYQQQTIVSCFNSLHLKYRYFYYWKRNKQTHKQMQYNLRFGPFSLILFPFHNFLCNRTSNLTCYFDMMKFTQCQSETWFRNAHFSEWHTMPIWKCFRLANVLKWHTTHARVHKILKSTQTIPLQKLAAIPSKFAAPRFCWELHWLLPGYCTK